jgi:hypothetical protein
MAVNSISNMLFLKKIQLHSNLFEMWDFNFLSFPSKSLNFVLISVIFFFLLVKHNHVMTVMLIHAFLLYTKSII